MTAWRVLVTCPHLQRTIERHRAELLAAGVEVDVPALVQQLSEAELLAIIDRYDGVIAGDDPFTARVLERGRRLRVIAKWGIGLDAIDQEAAQRLGIAVHNTPDVFADEVADVVMGYLILLTRQLHVLDRAVRAGGWPKVPGRSLSGRTLGIVGVGSIGRAVARRAAVAGMRLLGLDPRPAPADLLAETGLRMVPLDELLAGSDAVTLNCALTPQNRHLLDARAFAKLKPGALLVNTARGALIDEDALAASLACGRVAACALDVFETEPLPEASPLRRFEQCIFGTHNASNTEEAVERVNRRAIANLLAGLGQERAG